MQQEIIDENQMENQQESVAPNTINDITYNLANLLQDCRSARIISPAYATHNSELGQFLQYTYHATQFEYQKNTYVANILRKLAEQDLKNFVLIGETLIRLGVDPIYTAFPPIRANYYNTREICYSSNFITMTMCNINAVTRAIKEYKIMLTLLQNQEVKNIISYILLKKEEELVSLNQILNSLRG